MGERRMGLRRRLWVVGLAILTLYLVQLVNMLGLRGDLTRFGIRPRELSSLASIPVAPFIHEGFGHLAANTVPLFALGFLVCFRSLGSLAFVTLAVTLVSGLATWFLGRGGPQVGADGLVFGYFGFLLTAAVVERSPSRAAVVRGADHGVVTDAFTAEAFRDDAENDRARRIRPMLQRASRVRALLRKSPPSSPGGSPKRGSTLQAMPGLSHGSRRTRDTSNGGGKAGSWIGGAATSPGAKCEASGPTIVPPQPAKSAITRSAGSRAS